MQDSYKNRYIKKGGEYDDLKTTLTPLLPQKQNSVGFYYETKNYNNLFPTEFSSQKNFVYLPNAVETFSKTVEGKYSLYGKESNSFNETKSFKTDHDEFSTYGTSRLIKTMVTQNDTNSVMNCTEMNSYDGENRPDINSLFQMSRDKDLKVTFSDKYGNQYDSDANSHEYSTISKSEIPLSEKNLDFSRTAVKTEPEHSSLSYFKNYQMEPLNSEIELNCNKCKEKSYNKPSKVSKEISVKNDPLLDENIKAKQMSKAFEEPKQTNQRFQKSISKIPVLLNSNDVTDDIEMEIEEFEEVTTKTIPLFENLSNIKFNSRIDNKLLKRYENILLECNNMETEKESAFEEIFEERYSKLNTEHILKSSGGQDGNVALKRLLQTESICTETDILENKTTGEQESFKEWFSEYDQTYSVEQRNMMEKLYVTFQTNRSEFVKLIVELLAKRVKSIGIQSEVIETSDKHSNTNLVEFKNAFVGDFNSINVIVLDPSKLKAASIQVSPTMVNKFTCPMIKNLNDLSTMTTDLIETQCIELDHRIPQRSIFTQTDNIKPRKISHKPLETEKIIDNESKQLTSYEENITDDIVNEIQWENSLESQYKSPEFSISKFSTSSKHPFETRYESPAFSSTKHSLTSSIHRFPSILRYSSPKASEKFSTDRVEKYGIQNHRNSSNLSSLNRKRNGSSKRNFSRSARYSYEPLTFSDSSSSQLTKFNNFMRSTILGGYTIPVQNTLGSSTSKYEVKLEPSKQLEKSLSLLYEENKENSLDSWNSTID